MKEQKIALVIKTMGLEYDDRVRKEILTAQKLYPNINFKIYAMLPENKETEGITEYGIPYKSVYIPARDKYPSAKNALLKGYQFYKVLKKELEGYDAVWAANEDAAFVPLLLKNKHILWDLHELPSTFMGKKWKIAILKYIFHRCKVVLHANPQRKSYLEKIGAITMPAKHIALRNFPNFEDKDSAYDEKYQTFTKWKNGRKCIYLQGLNNDSRAAYESIAAVLHFPDFCAVVVGGFDNGIKDRLQKEYGKNLEERVHFVGKIPQLKIPQYMEQCYMSLIFYKNIRPNNFYCEANRFYQAIICGLPVVVGNNPSMKDLVEKYGFGFSIENDGNDTEKIIEGIKCVIAKYEEYHQRAIQYRKNLLWDKQEPIMQNILETLFKE